MTVSPPPPAVVTGYQQPSGAVPGHACQFYISLLDASHKEQRLDENGEDVFRFSFTQRQSSGLRCLAPGLKGSGFDPKTSTVYL